MTMARTQDGTADLPSVTPARLNGRVDALEILRAARVEIGRRLVAASEAGRTDEVEAHRRRIRHAGDATLKIQSGRLRVEAPAAEQLQGAA